MSILKNKSILIALIVILIAIIWQIQRLLNYSYKIADFRIKKISKDQLKGALILQFTNKSLISLSMLNMELDLYINNKLITTLIMPHKQELKPNATTNINLDFDVVPKSILQDAIGLLVNLQIEVRGFATINKLISFKMPINERFKLM